MRCDKLFTGLLSKYREILQKFVYARAVTIMKPGTKTYDYDTSLLTGWLFDPKIIILSRQALEIKTYRYIYSAEKDRRNGIIFTHVK